MTRAASGNEEGRGGTLDFSSKEQYLRGGFLGPPMRGERGGKGYVRHFRVGVEGELFSSRGATGRDVLSRLSVNSLAVINRGRRKEEKY